LVSKTSHTFGTFYILDHTKIISKHL